MAHTALCECHQGASHHPTLGHAYDMAEVTEAALANRTKKVVLWGCCCHSVVLASDYVQAAAVKTVHTVHHWLSERPGFRCISSYYVLSFNARDNRWSVHMMESYPNVVCAMTSKIRRERGATSPSHQRAAWIFNPRCVGKVREQASHVCASFRASTSASVVELTRVLWWICMTLLLACDITISEGASSQCGHPHRRAQRHPRIRTSTWWSYSRRRQPQRRGFGGHLSGRSGPVLR